MYVNVNMNMNIIKLAAGYILEKPVYHAAENF
jgi:hypothetical protein